MEGENQIFNRCLFWKFGLASFQNFITIKDCGHFSFLEKPHQVAKIILK